MIILTTDSICGDAVQDKGLVPFLCFWDGTDEDLFDGQNYGCKSDGRKCSGLIYRNNWKIPKNYPKKIHY